MKKPQQDLAAQVVHQVGATSAARSSTLGFKGISWYVGNWFGAEKDWQRPVQADVTVDGSAPMSIRIGIGSWSDEAYRGVLYPPGLPASDRLRHYAKVFDHVEVNSTYYGAPKPEAVKKWIGETPARFSLRHQAAPHFLAKPEERRSPTEGKRDLLGYTLERLEPLMAAKKLGVFLLLLTARFGPAKHSLAELDALVERLRPFPLAVELRDPGVGEGRGARGHAGGVPRSGRSRGSPLTCRRGRSSCPPSTR